MHRDETNARNQQFADVRSDFLLYRLVASPQETTASSSARHCVADRWAFSVDKPMFQESEAKSAPSADATPGRFHLAQTFLILPGGR
jgi:hypothetical protein